MAKRKLEFFVYDHSNREFSYFDSDRGRLEEIMMAENPDAISDALEDEEIDGMLVLDESGGRWFLAFATSLGIVGQRTARRQADTIVRSGYNLPDGYWLKANYPMEELSDPNIGDLWKTVQQKYVIGDLKGMALDEETGIPSQLADRAKELEKEGLADELADAKFEKEEAAERARHKAKTEGGSKKKTSKKKATKKKATKKKATKKKATKKKATKKKASKKKTAKKESEENKLYIEIDALSEYVYEGYTRFVIKGDATEGSKKPKKGVFILDPNNVSQKEWNEIAVFLEEKDVIEADISDSNDGKLITSLKI